MDRLDIEIFITILQEKNILRAANLLYLAPSTVGNRLRSLEQELGIELIERRKGIRNVVLTEKGELFAQIAKNLLSSWNDCDHLKNQPESISFSIATADSFLEHNLVPLYQQIADRDPHFHLDIQLYPSDMIYPLVSKKMVNIGFALYNVRYPDVVVEPLFSDDVVVVVPQDSPITGTSIHPRNLDPERELFIGSRKNRNVGWGSIFNTWHDEWFNVEKEPLIRVNSVSILSYFLTSEHYWTFLPRITANGFCRDFNLRMLELKVPAPRRSCYKLTHCSNSQTASHSLDVFDCYLREYLSGLTGGLNIG